MPVLPLESDDPRVIGRHRLTGRLGEGGQGVVYLGESPDGQPVAVKVLKTTADAALARFAREMEAAKRVAPFCTAAVLESSTTGRHPYVVSEYVDGPSLQQRVYERGPLRGGDLDRLMVNTASGLTAIHGAGIVHRDLKPANVLLGPDGPRVVDFGIARAVDAETHTQMVGTPAYFAPEWLRGEQPTPASDVFAWAGTMVFAATAQPPFGGGSNIPALMHRIATQAPDLSAVPEQVRGLLAECLDKDPARRPTARDLLVRLADPSVGSGAQAPVPPTVLGPPTQPPGPQAWRQPPGGPPAGHLDTVSGGRPAPRRRTGLLVVGAAAVTAALLAGLWFVLPKDKDDPPADKRKTAQNTQSPSEKASPQPSASQSGGGSATIPAEWNGTWKGSVEQAAIEGIQKANTTNVTIYLTGGSPNGRAEYPGWGCENSLKLTSASGSTLEFDESVTKDKEDTKICQGGTVKLTMQDGKLKYDSPGLLGPGTTGTLSRG